MPYLLFSRSSHPSFKFSLKSSTTKIGRAESCDIVLNEADVSREHAALFLVQNQYWLKKTGRAPLLLNGREIESHSIRAGEKFQIGSWSAEFLLESSTSPADEPTVWEEGAERTQAVLGAGSRLMFHDLILEVLEPGKNLREYPFRDSVVNLGALEKNDIVLQDPTVSGRHLKLVRDGESMTVFDLGSTNGTIVNGVKVREAELEPGFQIRVGQTTLRLVHREKVETVAPIATEEFFGMIGGSPRMQTLYGLLSKIGPIDATALILGESGTGKELVSRAVHRLSSRAKAPFVAINCGAISPELMESELFGHEKGAFTGALRQHEGAVGQARGGTLFLDEIGELSPELQPKLLRLLENKTYRRVGGLEELSADIRIVAATHRDLGALVEEKKFREDLFFRLFVLPIALPALRDRIEDLPRLTEAFLREFAPGGNAKRLSDAAMEKLRAYPFPGNIRELKNLLLRAMILSEGESIGVADLQFNQELSGAKRASISENCLERLEEMEKRMVVKALAVHRGNKTRAAEALGVAKSTLFAKIKLYGIEDGASAGN